MREIETLLEARYPLIAVETSEEHRVLSIVNAWVRGKDPSGTRPRATSVVWTITRGFAVQCGPAFKSAAKPGDALAILAGYAGPIVATLPDFGPFLADPVIARALRETIEAFRTGDHARTIVLTSPAIKLPAEIERYGAVIDLPLPDRTHLATIAAHVDDVSDARDIENYPEVVDALAGLSEIEAENAIAKSRAITGGLDPAILRAEKKQIARKSGGVLEYVDTDISIADVGGLEELKTWIADRKIATTPEARAAGIRPPKGFVTVGPSGVGKSLVAKATASILGRPLIRGDLGAVKGGLVGASEANMRCLLRTAEAMSPCVLWLDEIEKGFAGASGSNDSGASAGVFGTFLTWRQETTADVFVVATANDVSGLPPELLRRGRFDEIFFIDLPNETERRAILATCLRRVARLDAETAAKTIHVDACADEMAGYSGAEIEYIVSEAMLAAFARERPISTDHIRAVKARTIPLSETMGERIEALRTWAKGRARPATLSVREPEPVAIPSGRKGRFS